MPGTRLIFIGILVLALALPALALFKTSDSHAPIRIKDIEACSTVQRLSSIKDTFESADGESPLMKRLFALLFPFDSPAYNSLLATFYISSFPNLILGFIPADIELSSLNTMISFATGGLLGDVFLNLIPHSFMGEPSPEAGVSVVLVEPRRNIVVGTAIFSGFALFFLLDKTMRYLSSRNGDSDSSGHSHSHNHSHSTGSSSALAGTDKDTASTLKKRGSSTAVEEKAEVQPTTTKEVGASLQLGAYLNLFADFTHNITDGLAMSAAFFASPTIGATTTLACFAHEIPHEIADFSILVKSGFSKKKAMLSQFITAIGAFVGTLLGIFIQKMAAAGAEEVVSSPDLVASVLHKASGILQTTVTGADLVIPCVAGSFLYIASVSVVPELLEASSSGRQLLKEAAAMAFGISCMALIAWNE
ncbi:Putative zinc transporter [Phaffia rhodozyma]|uniref:Putative zinc transporter n=1 Tax=Phaffia rhodozyma TaxID=264483 RepID=A0A0F7SFV8_PHARH|nr:Putative zinc transporter [Phaffia rhodozyma]